MSSFKKVLHFIRWWNVLLATTPLIVLYSILKYYSKQEDIPCGKNFIQFIILCLSVQSLMAAGFVFNDIQDQPIDKINRPTQYCIGKTLSSKTAHKLFALFSFCAFALSTYLTIYVFTEWIYFAVGVYLSLVLYSLFLKQSPLVGNILIASLAATLPIVMLYFSGDCIERISVGLQIKNMIYTYSIFTFTIMLPREINLDIEDMEGDKRGGCKTIPILLGVQRAKYVIILFVFCSLLLSVYWVSRYLDFLIAYIIIDIYLLFYCYLLIKAKQKSDFIQTRNHLRYILLVGLVTFVLSALTFG